MANRGSVSWAVMNGRTWQLECQRCGATEKVESPIGVSDLWRQAEAFEDRHRECEEKKEDSRGVAEARREEEEKRTDRSDDVLYERAVRLVLTEQRCSVSMLQGLLDIGYVRASCLINRMVSDGLLARYDPLRGYRQKVLMTLEQWEAKKK